MPGAAACSLQRLDDNLAQHVISYGSLDSCKALSLTCRRFCHLVQTTRTFQLNLGVLDGTPQRLAQMPLARAYQGVYHLSFKDADQQTGYPGDLGSFVRLCHVMGAAVQRWPGVERITLAAGQWAAEDISEGCGYLLGAVVPLQQATGLRSLTIDHLLDSYSLQYLRALTQLTELRLTPSRRDSVFLALSNPPRAPLADMTHLKALCLGTEVCDDHLTLGTELRFGLSWEEDVNEADLPPVLPPHVTRLEIACQPWCLPGMFWRHIAACTGLVSLRMHIQFHTTALQHPSWMLHQLAGSLGCLEDLYLAGDHARFVAKEPPHLPEALGLLAATEAGQQQQEEQGWDWEDLAAPGLGATARYNFVVVPPPNMNSFAALHTLKVESWWLRCCGPHHWYALAGCRGLQQLQWLDAWAVPPAGVKFPGVTNLKLLMSSPTHGVSAVLGAFPALQQLQLKMQPQQQQEEEGDEPGTGPAQQQAQQAASKEQVVLSSLTRATIRDWESGEGAVFASLWCIMPALQHLELGWSPHDDLLQQLPPVAALPGLRSLTLSSWQDFRRLTRNGPQRVNLQALLRVLQGGSQLEELELQLSISDREGTYPTGGCSSSDSDRSCDSACSSSSSSSSSSGDSSDDADSANTGGNAVGSKDTGWISQDQLVLQLQEALPSLRRVLLTTKDAEQPLAAETIAALHPGLQVGPASKSGMD